jgi:hypothetical protein
MAAALLTIAVPWNWIVEDFDSMSIGVLSQLLALLLYFIRSIISGKISVQPNIP